MRNQNPSGSDDVTLTITLEHAFQEKKSQSQNSIQHFEFSRPFFSTGSRAIAAQRAEWQAYYGLPVLRKCGKIQNVVSSTVFEIFSPEMHAPESTTFRSMSIPYLPLFLPTNN